MFVRVKRSARNGRTYEYLQIVRSVRQGKAVRQQVLGTLGWRDELLASGELDKLLVSLGAFSEKLAVVERVRTSPTRLSGASSAPSARRSPRWRSARSSTTAMTPRSGTSSAASWHCASRWTCSAGWSSAR
jgi:hypothetical protein